ncbi:MAG: hypothetical protein WC785_08490 [Tatlockia sp.]|jgi:hypothetical protein
MIKYTLIGIGTILLLPFTAFIALCGMALVGSVIVLISPVIFFVGAVNISARLANYFFKKMDGDYFRPELSPLMAGLTVLFIPLTLIPVAAFLTAEAVVMGVVLFLCLTGGIAFGGMNKLSRKVSSLFSDSKEKDVTPLVPLSSFTGHSFRLQQQNTTHYGAFFKRESQPSADSHKSTPSLNQEISYKTRSGSRNDKVPATVILNL